MLSYKTIMFKISGEAFSDKGLCHDFDKIALIADNISKIVSEGYKICLVIGGGNIFRGREAENYGLSRAKADYIGMTATIVNGMILHQFLLARNLKTQLFSSLINDSNIAVKFNHDLCLENLENNVINIFCGGVALPYFTTDTAAVLKAVEMKCDVLLKATQVDGIYNDDPKRNNDSLRFDNITYGEILAKRLKIMDFAAIALAQEHNLPIIVFSLQNIDNLYLVLKDKIRYSMIKG